MRSIVWRAGVPLVGLLLFASSDTAAMPTGTAHGGSALGTAATSVRQIHVGGTYRGPRVADVDLQARAVLRAHTSAASGAAFLPNGVDRLADGGSIVRYAQSHLGLPVIGRGAAVRLSRDGQPVVTTLALESDLPASARAAVSPDAAAAAAAARLGVAAFEPDAHLVIWPTLDRGARLAYAVVPRIPAGVPSAPRAIVDAETGEIIEARDTIFFADEGAPKARVFEENPTKTPDTVVKALPLSPVGPGLSHELIEATNCVDNKTVKPVSMFGFQIDVHVCDLEQVALADEDGDFLYEPSDEPGSEAAREDAFSEVSIYYHVAKAYTFFRELLGDDEAQVVADKPLRLVANLKVPAGLMTGDIAKAGNPDTPLDLFQNAFYSPAGGGLGGAFQQLYGFDSGALWFGQGMTRDFAYDGDVVYHEFGHAVVDDTLGLRTPWHLDARGLVGSPGAMHEAIADYFSSAITGDPNVGEYASEELSDGGGAIRTLDNTDACPSGLVGQAHVDSTVFSGALWQARTSLPEGERRAFDQGLFRAMRTYSGDGDLGFEDVAELFLATLKTEHPAGAAALETAMTSRGLLPWCERVASFEGKPVQSRDARLAFTAPGKQSVGVRQLAPGIMQVRAAVPPGARSVEVSFVMRAAAGGGLGPFGGNAKPFAPVVLAKLGEPITWSRSPQLSHDAELTAKITAKSGNVRTTLELPEGSTADVIYVQIANDGDADGAYDKIGLSFGEGGEEVDDVVVEEVAEPAADDDAATASSCGGCTSAAASSTSRVLPAVALALAGVLVARRRRQSDSERTR